MNIVEESMSSDSSVSDTELLPVTTMPIISESENNPAAEDSDEFVDDDLEDAFTERLNEYRNTLNGCYRNTPKKRPKKQLKLVRLRVSVDVYFDQDEFVDEAGFFSALPVVIIHNIMTHLSIGELYGRLGFANKAMFVLVRKMPMDNYTVDMTTAMIGPSKRNQRVLLDALSKIGTVGTVKSIIIGNLDFTTFTWKNLLKRLPNLQSIQFNGTRRIAVYENIQPVTLQFMAGQICRTINSFVWLGRTFVDNDSLSRLFYMLGASLHHFEIEVAYRQQINPNVLNGLLCYLAEECPNIKTLKATFFTSDAIMPSSEAMDVLSSTCKNLEVFVLRRIFTVNNKKRIIDINRSMFFIMHGELSDESLALLRTGRMND